MDVFHVLPSLTPTTTLTLAAATARGSSVAVFTDALVASDTQRVGVVTVTLRVESARACSAHLLVGDWKQHSTEFTFKLGYVITPFLIHKTPKLRRSYKLYAMPSASIFA